ncbi:MAG: LysM peptidoglycan-binding domain-containing protein [Anaerolineales bacterium]|nr:MAG: LysM peptidoglycan-binding domain-containing protein [Anaerolineales bacterium]
MSSILDRLFGRGKKEEEEKEKPPQRVSEEAARKRREELAAERQRMADARKRFEEEQKNKEEAKEEKAKVKQVYVVKSGDSLSKIAKELMGDAKRWPEIYELNKELIGDDPNVIHPGQELKIPE